LFYHPAQEHRVSGGRGILKTTSGFQILTSWTLSSPRQGTGIYTAPFHNAVKKMVWNEVNTWLEGLPVKVKLGENATDLTIRLIDGKFLAFIGLDKYDRHRGIHQIAEVHDEVARSRKQAFEEVLGPARMSHKGPSLDITTPRGRNWWMKRWEEGTLPEYPEVVSWKIKAEEVGMISKADLAKQRARLSESMYLQEWEAEFTGADGPVFPSFIEKMWPEGHLMPPGLVRQEMARGGYMVGALDWALSGTACLLWVWVTKAGGLMALDELTCTRQVPPKMMTMARARRMIPNRIVLDSQCWANTQVGEGTDGRTIYDSFRRATPRTAYIQSDKRFQPSIVRLNELMTLEGVETFPKFCIEAGKCPNLTTQLLELQEEDIKPSGAGFRDASPCDAVDAIRYAAMSARSGVGPSIQATSAEKGPLWNHLHPGASRAQDIQTGFDSLTGEPIWGART